MKFDIDIIHGKLSPSCLPSVFALYDAVLTEEGADDADDAEEKQKRAKTVELKAGQLPN
ncbi:MAG: hypothetical protein ACT4PQ_09340 [Betaproteobacteria bacterium]